MKKYLIFLIILFALMTSPCYGGMNVAIVGGGGSSAATSNITANVWLTFEANSDCTAAELDKSDGLAGANWDTTSDTQSKLNCVSTAADKTMVSTVNTSADTGTKGMAIDLSGTAGAIIQFYTPSTYTSISTGFWYYTPTIGNNNWHPFHSIKNTNGTAYVANFGDTQNAGGGAVNFALSGNATTISASVSTWYWVTMGCTRNSTCSLSIYTDDTGTSQVGSTITTNTADYDMGNYLFWGITAAVTVATTSYMDNILIDWTDGTFPLIGQ